MPDPKVRYVVAEPTHLSISDEQLNEILEIATELANGRGTARSAALIQICAAPLLRELLQRRHAMASIQTLSDLGHGTPAPAGHAARQGRQAAASH